MRDAGFDAALGEFRRALEERLAGAEDTLDAVSREAVRARRGFWDEVRARVTGLGWRLRGQEATLGRELSRAAPRERAREALGWVIALNEERRVVEREIWQTLDDAARTDRELWQSAQITLASALQLRGRLNQAARDTVDAATADEAATLGRAPAHASLARRLADALARARAELGERGRAVESGLAERAALRWPDWSRAKERFARAAAEALGAAPSTATTMRQSAAPAARRASPRPKRKNARVPAFLVNRFYKKGSLTRVPGGVELTFVNPIGFAIIAGADPPLVDGQPFAAARTRLEGAHKRLMGDALSNTNYLKFPKGGAIQVTFQGLSLAPGEHRISIALELRKLGWVDLKLVDRLS